MRVAVLVPGPSPYVFGGAERVARGLAGWIDGNTPHSAEVLMPPSPEGDLVEVMSSYRAWESFDVSGYDVVVSTKYPSWMVGHPHHVVLMFHPLRGLYDTYGAARQPWSAASDDPVATHLLRLVRRPPERSLVADVFGCFDELVAALGPDDPLLRFPGPLARELVHFLDRVGLDPSAVRAHFGISATVAVKRGYFPTGVTAGVLVTPSNLEGLHCGRSDHLFTASRLDGPKRIDLLIEAMRHVHSSDVTLKIAGTGPDEARLRDLAASDPRVELVGHVTDDELVALYADALAVAFVPADEDLGLITLEAQMSSKPVVTCSDSGGPTELVVHGVSGLVAAPRADAVGTALDSLVAAPAVARRMGLEGHERARRHTWARVAGAILESADHPPTPARRAGRPKLVVTSTFPVHPPLGGGQLRCHHLYGALTDAFDVEIVSLAPPDHRAERVVHGPGFVETVVPRSAAHQERERLIEARAGFPITDIVAAPLMPLTPDYPELLAAALRGAGAVILAHPFLAPLARDLGPDVPVIYDAHNAEWALKDALLPASRIGDGLRGIVDRVEGLAVRSAAVVTGCSLDDHGLLARRFGEHRFVHVPNGVDAAAVRFTDRDERRRAGIRWREAFGRFRPALRRADHLAAFVGSWHPPNLEAVERILSFASALPEVAFVVAGSVGHGFPARRLPPNVVMLGVVSEPAKAALLAAADVALAPLTAGSGTNLKVVEYLAAGIPTVATPVATRGIDVEPGRHVALGAVEDFPGLIRGLLASPDETDAMTRAGRRLVEDRYDWSILAATMRGAVSEVLGTGRSVDRGAGPGSTPA